MGSLEGVFAAEEQKILDLMGKEIYFGEVLGKHSEIHGELEEEDCEVLTDDQEFIEKAAQYKLIPCGFNPLSYYEPNEDDSEV